MVSHSPRNTPFPIPMRGNEVDILIAEMVAANVSDPHEG